MNWLRYSGRIILGLGVIAIALWATENKLIETTPTQFWGAILVYLVCAEVAWTLVDRRGREAALRLPRSGLHRLSRWDRVNVTISKWFFDGGRTRFVDILVKHDFMRDSLQSLQAAVFMHETGPRVHLLVGKPGSGRSTLLLRLGRMLSEQGQQVFIALPGPELTSLEPVIAVAKKQQVYLLVDDLDLRPQTEEWLYELHRASLPVVVVGTVNINHQTGPDDANFERLKPAGLLSRAVRHNPQTTANDLAGIARKLESFGRLDRPGLSLETTADLLAAVRYLQGKDPDAGLWTDLDGNASLPQHHKLMLALCGLAEVAIPDSLYVPLFGAKAIGRWQRANLLWLDDCYALPPHRHVCLDLLQKLDPGSQPVLQALADLIQISAQNVPAFACRLLYGLARASETRELVQGIVEALPRVVDPASWPASARRSWNHVLLELGQPLPETQVDAWYPPELLLQTQAAFACGDYQTALALSRTLTETPLYAAAGTYNFALALMHLDQLDEAERVLAALKPGPAGTHYLRGMLAEKKGDWLHALDAYEESRKADELLLPATRRLAFAYLKTGAPRAAIPLFEAVLSYTPLQPDLYGGLAVAHLQAGMAQRAAAQSARAIQSGVEPSDARKAVARACAEVNAYARVAAELEACLSYDDEDPEAWAGLAEACRWLGRFKREEECLRRLQAADPDDDEVRLQIARNQRDQGETENALELLEPLLTSDAPPLSALLLACEVLAGRKDPALQEALARQALAQGETTGWAFYWLADSLEERSPAATEAFAQAIAGLKQQLVRGVTPRRAAKVWQAVYLAALSVGDETAAADAARKARQEVAICEALGAEVESVAHHRSVPPELFLESLPPGAGALAESSQPRAEPKAPAPAEAVNLRTRFWRTQGRG